MRSLINDRGAALPIAVLIAGTLMALAATSYQRAQSHSQASLIDEQLSHARAAIDAGYFRALAGLRDNAWSWRVDAQPFQFDLGEAEIRIEITNEGALIPINHADDPLLTAALIEFGVDEVIVPGIIEQLDQFAPAGPTPEETGSALADEPASVNEFVDDGQFGLDLPRRQLLAIDQLNGLDGLDDAVFEALKPHVSVYSDRSIPDQFLVNEKIQNIMQTMADDPSRFGAEPAYEEEALVDGNRLLSDDEAALVLQSDSQPLWSDILTFVPQPAILRVTIEAEIAAGTRAQSSLVLALTDTAIDVLAWQSLLPGTGNAPK